MQLSQVDVAIISHITSQIVIVSEAHRDRSLCLLYWLLAVTDACSDWRVIWGGVTNIAHLGLGFCWLGNCYKSLFLLVWRVLVKFAVCYLWLYGNLGFNNGLFHNNWLYYRLSHWFNNLRFCLRHLGPRFSDCIGWARTYLLLFDLLARFNRFLLGFGQFRLFLRSPHWLFFFLLNCFCCLRSFQNISLLLLDTCD